MLKREVLAKKILLLGVDGMDPRLTKKFVEMGLMPNVKQYIERGACREDLTMLGGHPTVTPPMWTTLACGCYANVHGITGFNRKGENIDMLAYNIDSRLCQAEQLWNVFAEAGKKTLVFHWPGSSWPPSSSSENLYVVDGSSPGGVGMSMAQVEGDFLVSASEKVERITYKEKIASEATPACIITDLETNESETNEDAMNGEIFAELAASGKGWTHTIYNENQSVQASTEIPLDLSQSTLKPANGWEAAPHDAKEFVILFSHGLVRRPALALKNAEGIYDRVAIYKNKKEIEPICIIKQGELVVGVIDDVIKNNIKYKTNRNLKLLEIDPEGKTLYMYVSPAMNIECDKIWHPKRLFKAVTENVGYPVPTVQVGCQAPMLITGCMWDNWNASAEWQASAMQYIIDTEDIDVVFSHYHGPDLQGHMFMKHLTEQPFNKFPHDVYEKYIRDVYTQTDKYLGEFMHYLDEGWTIIIFSDHALVSSKNEVPMLIDVTGTCTPVMEELGYTVMKDNGKGGKVIDWEKTKAVVQGEGHIYLNLKGREPYGIVDPADKYELEEEIMTALYGYRDKKTGHRIVSVALRNRDAILLGQGGPHAGDICIWHAEGYNYDHADCLSTTWGEDDTSVSPIFIGAGPGFKKGVKTERIIRQIDFAATVAVLGGVRMPAQCEGAPVYQILTEEY